MIKVLINKGEGLSLGAAVSQSIVKPVIFRVCETEICTRLSWDDEYRSLLLGTGAGTSEGMYLSIVMMNRVRLWREQP